MPGVHSGWPYQRGDSALHHRAAAEEARAAAAAAEQVARGAPQHAHSVGGGAGVGSGAAEAVNRMQRSLHNMLRSLTASG